MKSEIAKEKKYFSQYGGSDLLSMEEGGELGNGRGGNIVGGASNSRDPFAEMNQDLSAEAEVCVLPFFLDYVIIIP